MAYARNTRTLREILDFMRQESDLKARKIEDIYW